MKRVAITALAFFAVMWVATFEAASAHAAQSRMLVSGYEWGFNMSRLSLPVGEVTVQFVNRGEDDHNFRIGKLNRRKRAGRTVLRSPNVSSGEQFEQQTSLRPGRYRLWCSLPGHRRLGMEAPLRVR